MSSSRATGAEMDRRQFLKFGALGVVGSLALFLSACGGGGDDEENGEEEDD